MTEEVLNGGPDDSLIDARIGMLLRIGMLVSAAVVLIGGAIYLCHQGYTVPNYRVFHGAPLGLATFHGIFGGVVRGSGLAIIQLGLLLLIATPIARVMFSVIAFLLGRDYLYVFISAVVLFVLLDSLFRH